MPYIVARAFVLVHAGASYHDDNQRIFRQNAVDLVRINKFCLVPMENGRTLASQDDALVSVVAFSWDGTVG